MNRADSAYFRDISLIREWDFNFRRVAQLVETRRRVCINSSLVRQASPTSRFYVAYRDVRHAILRDFFFFSTRRRTTRRRRVLDTLDIIELEIFRALAGRLDGHTSSRRPWSLGRDTAKPAKHSRCDHARYYVNTRRSRPENGNAAGPLSVEFRPSP